MRTCLKRYARLAGDRRAALAGDEVAQEQVVEHGVERRSTSGSRCATAPAQKMRPITAARWSSRFSLRRQPVDARGDHRLERVRDPLDDGRRSSSSIRDRLLDEERVALGLLEQRLALRRPTARGRRAARRRAPRSRRARAARARSRRRAARPPPQPGRMSSSSGRARQRISSGASSTRSRRCSISSSSGSSAQWMSSKTRISGCASASSVGPLARRPGDLLLAALALDRLEHAGRRAPSRSATASSPHWARSFSTASWTGSSSVMPAATLTISASGQYVTPSPYGQRSGRRGSSRPRRPSRNSRASRLLPTPGSP